VPVGLRQRAATDRIIKLLTLAVGMGFRHGDNGSKQSGGMTEHFRDCPGKGSNEGRG